jgi:hypothetical protein
MELLQRQLKAKAGKCEPCRKCHADIFYLLLCRLLFKRISLSPGCPLWVLPEKYYSLLPDEAASPESKDPAETPTPPPAPLSRASSMVPVHGGQVKSEDPAMTLTAGL